MQMTSCCQCFNQWRWQLVIIIVLRKLIHITNDHHQRNYDKNSQTNDFYQNNSVTIYFNNDIELDKQMHWKLAGLDFCMIMMVISSKTNYNDDDGWSDHSLKCKWPCGFCLNRIDSFLLNYLKLQPDHFQQIRK